MLELLYALQNRLETCAVASVTLLGQDFKLKKAIDQFGTVAKASPVLAKIHQSATNLVEKESNQKPQDLLDLLALISAVIVTQTTTTSGNELTIPLVYTSEYKNIPTKTLQGFHDNIYQTGGGRLNVLTEILKDTSLYSDYRILRGMIVALDDSYSEIATLMIEKLSLLGEEIIPVLKKDFDTEKDTIVAKKIVIISNINKDKDDAFYKEMFVAHKKSLPIRAAALEAVEATHANATYFKELFSTSRNESLRDICFNKLVTMSYLGGENYINDFTEDILVGSKKLDIRALTHNTSQVFGDFLVDEIEKLIALYPPKIIGLLQSEKEKRDDQENDQNKAKLLLLSVNKPSPKWYAFILDLLAGRKKLFTSGWYNNDCILDVVIAHLMTHGEKTDPDFVKDVLDVVCKRGAAIQFLQDLTTLPANELFDTYAPYFTKGDKTIKRDLFFIIHQINYTRATDEHFIYPRYCNSKGHFIPDKTSMYIVLKQPLDPRWYEVIADYGLQKKGGKNHYEDIMDLVGHSGIYNHLIINNYTIPCSYRNEFNFYTLLCIMNPEHTTQVKSLLKYFMENRNRYWIGRYEDHENHVFWVQVSEEILIEEAKIDAKKEAKKEAGKTKV